MLPYNKENIERAKKLRKNMTPWESKLWYCFLRGYPVTFQRQKVIESFIVDFYCAKAGLVIELDGSGHFEREQMEKDQFRTNRLSTHNLLVLRFTNLDLDRRFSDVCEEIDRVVKQRMR